MASRFVHILEGEEVRREQQKREVVEAHKQQSVEAPVTWFKELEERSCKIAISSKLRQPRSPHSRWEVSSV